MGVEREGEDITGLVRAAREGEDGSAERLFTAIYDELKVIARSVPRVGRPGDTLQATVLTNEVFVEMSRRFPAPPKSMPESRRTFFRSVALAMRKVVYEHARERRALKRGGGRSPSPLPEGSVAGDGGGEVFDAVMLDEALTALEAHHPRWYAVVMHRYFGGRTNAETAELVGVAVSTVASDWSLARAWLLKRMAG